MPKRRAAWSSWNYLGQSKEIAAAIYGNRTTEFKPVFVTYWLNKVCCCCSFSCFPSSQELQ